MGNLHFGLIGKSTSSKQNLKVSKYPYILTILNFLILSIIAHVSATFNLVIIIGFSNVYLVYKVLTLTRIWFLIFLPIIVMLTFMWKIRDIFFISLSIIAWIFCFLALLALITDIWLLKNIFDFIAAICYLVVLVYSTVKVILYIKSCLQ